MNDAYSPPQPEGFGDSLARLDLSVYAPCPGCGMVYTALWFMLGTPHLYCTTCEVAHVPLSEAPFPAACEACGGLADKPEGAYDCTRCDGLSMGVLPPDSAGPGGEQASTLAPRDPAEPRFAGGSAVRLNNWGRGLACGCLRCVDMPGVDVLGYDPSDEGVVLLVESDGEVVGATYPCGHWTVAAR